MKKLIILSITLGLSFSGLQVDAGGPGVSGFPNNLHKHIESRVDYPRDARINRVEGFVLLSLEIDSDGFARVLEINSSDPLLKNHVEDRVRSIRLCPFDERAGMTHNLKFEFNLKSS